MLKKVIGVFKDRCGYGIAELLLIVSILGVIVTGTMATLNTNFGTAATSVGTKINSYVDSWTGN
ncbi:MAG TPA: hypothetical protein PK728_04965 [Bacillota bacterium]|nr:hypothetical protein [Bacillota bacterium]